MPLSIRSREVDELATRLARRPGTTKTEAVRRALAHEIERCGPQPSLAEQVREIQARLASRGRTGLQADKAFHDRLCEE